MRSHPFATFAISLAAITCTGAQLCLAQLAPKPSAGLSFAVSEISSSNPVLENATKTPDATDLPESPSSTRLNMATGEGQTGHIAVTQTSGNVASKYEPVIPYNQVAQPLTGREKATFALRNAVSPYNFVSIIVSGSFSQALDSAPHYGQGWAPYGQRIGAAAARNTIQTLGGQAVFAPLFHDDPRYYQLGRQHKVVSRMVYAVTRVAITRNDAGNQGVNGSLLLAYGVAAAVNNAYYPERDRGAKETATSFATSLGGAAIGMGLNEFASDLLGLVHLQRYAR